MPVPASPEMLLLTPSPFREDVAQRESLTVAEPNAQATAASPVDSTRSTTLPAPVTTNPKEVADDASRRRSRTVPAFSKLSPRVPATSISGAGCPGSPATVTLTRKTFSCPLGS
jgi:hypothetical protein